MLKAGISTACLYPQPVEEALYDLSLGGVNNVELFINTHSELRRDFVASMAEIMRRFDVSCCSMHPYTSEMEPMMLFSAYQRRVADCLEYCRHYFSAMQQVGASIFVVHGNKQIGMVDTNLYFERYEKLVQLGNTFGIIVAQENVARCTSRSLAFLKQMKQELGSSAQFVLDIKQAVRSQEDPMQILQALGSHVVHVHISDHGEYGDCLQIGKGRFDINTFLMTLSQVQPDCSVVLELYRSGFRTLQELLQNYHVLQNKIQNLIRKE